MKRQERSFTLPETLTLVAIGVFLAVAGFSRHSFIGDGMRHLPATITSARPPIGEPRWLFFPTLIWAIVHPFAMAGWVTTVEEAVRPFLVVSVLAGVAYVLALQVWLRADGYSASRRTAAILLAAATFPFLSLYSDIAEPQLAAAAVVMALAFARVRWSRGACTSGTALTVIIVIAAASLVYQGLIVALAFVPLVIPWHILRRRSVLFGGIAVLVATVGIVIGTRMLVGDTVGLAVTSLTMATANPMTRIFLSTPTPIKWLAALIAGPPQAIVALDNFSGLRALVGALVGALMDALRNPHDSSGAFANVARLAIGFLLTAVMMWGIVRRRDWGIVIAIAGLVALPVVRNNQYAYVKFFILWPVIVALASTAFAPRQVVAVAALVFVLNASLIASAVEQGRLRRAEMSALYTHVEPNTCFFTSDWDAPFPYLWPGSTAAVITTVSIGADPAVQERALTGSLERCFCTASTVWTDVRTEAASVMALLQDDFHYTTLDLRDLLLGPDERIVVAAAPTAIYQYPAARAADMCRQIRVARERHR